MTRVLGLGVAAAVCALAFPVVSLMAAPADHTLDVVERVSKFQSFYKEAAGTDPETRWALWQKDYGHAAVPPGPEGEKMARTGLDAAWDKYPALIPQLPALTKTATDTANDTFTRINAVLKTDGTPIHAKYVLFVGQFDENAYTIPPMDGNPATVMMEVEMKQLKTITAHELAHAVHGQLAGVKNSFGGPIGETLFLEGLAMHTTKAVVPGLPDYAYVADEKWFATCTEKKAAVLAGIAPDLEKSGREIAMKYTFGQGNNGMQREAYCAAWFVFANLLKTHTLSELARVPEDQMVATIKAAMN